MDIFLFPLKDILEAFNRWKGKHTLPDDAHKKVGARSCSSFGLLFGILFGLTRIVMMQVKLLCSYCKKHDESEVPDPYYGGVQGFEKVMIFMNHVGYGRTWLDLYVGVEC